MKRLGFLACAALLTVGFFFSPQNVNAQTTEATYDYFQGIVSDYQNTAVQVFDTTAKRYEGTPDYTFQQKVSQDYKSLTEANYSAYINAFNAEKSVTGSTPADAQIKGIQAWIRSSTLGANLVKQRGYSSSPQGSAYNQYALKMSGDATTNAVQIKNNIITAGSPAASVQTNSAAITNAAAGNTNVAKQVADPKPDDCSLLSGNLLGCVGQLIAWVINNTLLQIAIFLVWITSSMLNLAIQVGILGFKDWAPDTLYPAWVMVRQIVSLFIVFAGLYLGFMYILGRDENFQKYIPWVIVFALFVNFSYPLVRTAVDVSNIVSLNIYSSVIGNEALQSKDILSANSAGGIIMDRLGLNGLIIGSTKTDAGTSLVGKLTALNSIPGSLLAIAFVLYAAYIFLMATGILVFRTLALVFLVIGSPLLFVDSFVPILGEKAKAVRKVLFEQLAVAPVFMIMLAITLKFLDAFGSITGLPQATVTSGAGTVTVFFNIAMMLGVLHIMLKVTKDTAGTIGTYATDAMGKVGGFGLGVATGGAGFLARGTLGRAAAVARDSKWVTNNQDSFIGRRAYSLSNSVASSTFDARNSDVVAGGMKKAGLDSGLLGMGGMSIGSKRTFQGQADKRKKEILDGASRIKTRYERDVYGKDAEGKKVLLHKEGDIDTDAEAALKRYNQNVGGGSLFMTKKDKELAAEELAKQATANNQKAKDEQGKLSSENLTAYNSVKKDKEKREAFVSNLKTELASLDKTDPERRGNKSEAVLKTLKEVEKTDKEDKEAFDKNVANVLYAYQKKTGADKDRYLTDQTQEIQEAVRTLTQPPASTALPQSIQRTAPAARVTPVDIDLTEKSSTSQNSGAAPTGFLALAKKERELRAARMAAQKSPEQIREEKQKVATEAARKEMETV